MYRPVGGVYLGPAPVSGVVGLRPVSDGRRRGFVETYESIPATLQSDVGATVLPPLFQGKEKSHAYSPIPSTHPSVQPIQALPTNPSTACPMTTFHDHFLWTIFLPGLHG